MQVILKIDGMHCTGCQNRLQNSLELIKDIQDLQVSLEEKQATFTTSNEDNINKVIQKIEDLGFTVTSIKKDSD